MAGALVRLLGTAGAGEGSPDFMSAKMGNRKVLVKGGNTNPRRNPAKGKERGSWYCIGRALGAYDAPNL